MKLIFASNNPHKLEEIRFALGHQLEILSLKEAGIDIEILEPHESLEENASEKSRTINQLTGMNCFSEDTGLEVEALNGRPGVRSARYAGDEKSFDKNIEKLLIELESETNRKARFRAVISLIWNGQETLFEGIVNGKIIHEKRGHSGFGYDPVFIPEGSDETFAEMSQAEKNKYSHRRRAVEKMVAFLSQQEHFISSPKTKAGP